MSDLKRLVIIILSILSLLIPHAIIYSNKEQAKLSNREEENIPAGGFVADEQSSFSSYNSESKGHIFRPQETDRTRGANGDLIMDWDGMLWYDDISNAPFDTLYYDINGFREYLWGVKNTTITYTPIVKNDGGVQINQFTLRLVVHEYIINKAGNWETRREFVNVSRNVGPLPAGKNTTTEGLNTSLSWKPQYASRIEVCLKIESVGDPDKTNNDAYFYPYVMREYNTVESGAEQNQWAPGNGWSLTSLAAQNDPDITGHTAPTVWEAASAGVQYIEYAVDLSNTKDNELPLYGAPNGGSTKGLFIGWTFSGSANPSTWSFDFWNSSSNSWDGQKNGNQGIDDSWYIYMYNNWATLGYNIYGSYLEDYYCTADFKFRATGTDMYLDDFWICSIENIPDTVRPRYLDRSNSTGTTADKFTFRVNATDDIEVDKIYVNWSQGNSGQNVSLNKATGYWIGNITLEDNLSQLSYVIYTNDTSNNYNISNLMIVNVSDNDPPTYNDGSPKGGTTGDVFTFNFTASDNIKMGDVFVNWKHGNMNQNLSLNKASGYWIGNISLAHNTSDLSYVSYANDTYNNYNISANIIVGVSDNDIPTFDDQSPNEGATGDQFTFRVSATDNIAVSSIHANWAHGGQKGNLSLIKNGNVWTGTITLDDSVDPLSYELYVRDAAANFNISINKKINVIDNVLPTISDNSPGVGTTGDNYIFDVAATDNIKVTDVYLNWSHGALGDNITLAETGNSWSKTIILDHSIEDLSYLITVVDSSNNIKKSNLRNVNVLDNDIASFTDLSAATGSTDDQFTFNVTAIDNIEVGSVFADWVHGDSSDNVSLAKSGEYWTSTITLGDDLVDLTYTISVKDNSDNFATGILQTVGVTDNDLPTLNDKSDMTGTTGDEFQFKVQATDNIEVETVYVDWEHGALGRNISLILDNGYWVETETLGHDTANLSF
ncbi:MAG: hypothetical protein QF682_13550, partial [Candidatus Thermoplasmatota archaeon]|nr:hypothetical protein [Candidatus Thermoplasmatota archaeon]